MKVFLICSGDPDIGYKVHYISTSTMLIRQFKKKYRGTWTMTVDIDHDEMAMKEIIKYGHELSEYARAERSWK